MPSSALNTNKCMEKNYEKEPNFDESRFLFHVAVGFALTCVIEPRARSSRVDWLAGHRRVVEFNGCKLASEFAGPVPQ
jgi:hypothetical protein